MPLFCLFPAELKSEYKDYFVPISEEAAIRTITMEPEDAAHGTRRAAATEQIPVVMIHGFGAGFLQFYKNLDYLHSERKLLAIDLPGFGRSTRVSFPSDATLAESQFINSIERWRKVVGVEKFILLGHSLGAYLACAYTMQHPSRVRHLVLVDPWGFAVKPNEKELREKFSSKQTLFWNMASGIMPFTFIRAAGPWGRQSLTIVCTPALYHCSLSLSLSLFTHPHSFILPFFPSPYNSFPSL